MLYFDASIVPDLVSGSAFKLASRSFKHVPSFFEPILTFLAVQDILGSAGNFTAPGESTIYFFKEPVLLRVHN